MPLQNASAAEVVRVINTLFQQQRRPKAARSPSSSSPTTARTACSSSGDQSQRLRIKALIAHLDTPLENGGDTQVRYLRYADAEKIATKLKEQITRRRAGRAARRRRRGSGAAPAAQRRQGTTIWAEPETNALIITAPPKIMRSLMAIIDKLDIRRMQVLVEAIIVEVTAEQDRRARRELGGVVERRRHAHPARRLPAARSAA